MSILGCGYAHKLIQTFHFVASSDTMHMTCSTWYGFSHCSHVLIQIFVSMTCSKKMWGLCESWTQECGLDWWTTPHWLFSAKNHCPGYSRGSAAVYVCCNWHKHCVIVTRHLVTWVQESKLHMFFTVWEQRYALNGTRCWRPVLILILRLT